MASISPVSNITLTPTQSPASQAAQNTAAARASAANDTTTYITNEDGTISVTTANAQGEIIEISTIPAAAASDVGSSVTLAPGALLNLVA